MTIPLRPEPLDPVAAYKQRYGAAPAAVPLDPAAAYKAKYLSRDSLPAFAAEGTATAPNQIGRRVAAAAEPPILSSGLPRELEQGATLGFGDEINAGARALFTKDSYTDALANERMIQHAYEQAHPIISTGAQLAGGAVLGVGSGLVRAAPAVATTSRFARAAKIVGGGAGIGAVAGAGNAEGDLSDRVAGAERGAVAGAVVAPIVAGTGALARKVVAPYLSRAIDATGIRAPATAAGPVLDDRAGVELTLPQRVGRRVGVQSVQDRADALVGKTITRGGQSIDDVRAAAANASTDKPITLADVGGEGAQQLAAGARTFAESGASTKVPKILRGRAEGAGTRMSEDMTAASGVRPVDPYQLADDMRAAQQKQAHELYATAYAKGAVPDETIGDMLKLPYFKDAYGFAKNLAKLEGRQLPERITDIVEPPQVPPMPKGFGTEAQWADAVAAMRKQGLPIPGAPGDVAPTDGSTVRQEKTVVPDVEALDMVKRGIDAQIQKNLGKNSIDKAAAVKLSQRLDEFLGKVDAQVPEYGKARAAYASGERMREALEAGRGAINKDPRLVERELAALQTSHEQGLYRYGLQDALNQVIAGTRDGAPIASKLAGSDVSRRQLAAIAKDAPAAQDLLKRAGEERTMAETNARVLGGSNTMDKAGARAAIEGAAGDEPARAPTSKVGAVRFLFGRVKAAAAELNPQTADAVANRLMSGTTNRQELLDALDQIDGLRKKGQLTAAKTRELLKLPAAAQAGRLVAPSRYK